jgi:hypothetical protein
MAPGRPATFVHAENDMGESVDGEGVRQLARNDDAGIAMQSLFPV